MTDHRSFAQIAADGEAWVNSEIDPTTWDPCDVCGHMMPDYERTSSEINTATGHAKCIHVHDGQLVATSALGACLCTSFTRNIVTDACKVCGHESHASRVHCGVMVNA